MSTRRVTRPSLIGVFALATILVLGAMTASGSTFRQDKSIHISNLHRIDDDFYAIGDKTTIDGVINGDLIATGYSTEIHGEVTGSANFAGRYFDHSGRIKGSLRAAGERITINGSIGNSLLTGCQFLSAGQGSVIENDVHAFAMDIMLGGLVKGNAHLEGETVSLTGVIEGDVEITAKKIVVSAPAVIKGSLTYHSPTEDALETGTGVTIVGETNWRPPEDTSGDSGWGLTDITLAISRYLAAFLFALLALAVFRPYAEESFEQFRSRPTVSFAAGLLGLIVLGACVVALTLALFMALISFGMLSGDVEFVGVFILAISTLLIPITTLGTVGGGVLLYSGKLIIAFVVGHAIISTVRKETPRLGKGALLLGLALFYIISEIPYLGFAVQVFGAIVGAGAIILGIKHCQQKHLPLLAGKPSNNAIASGDQ